MDPADYILNLNKINISDWQLFLDNNKVIKARLDNMNANVGNIKSYIDIIKTDSDVAHDNLLKIENETVRSISKITDSVDLLDKTNTRLKEKLATKSIQILSCLEYAEESINAYNNGTAIDESKTQSLRDILRGNISDNDFMNAGILSIETSPVTAGLLCGSVKDTSLIKLAFASGGNALLEKGIQTIWDSRLATYLEANGIFSDTMVSGVAMSTYIVTAADDYLNDKGDFTKYDTAYMLADAAQTATVATFSSAFASAIGGPVGFITSIGINCAARPLIEKISEIAAGETVTDTFTYNGKTYTIKKNGSGRKETGDVCIENMDYNILVNQKKAGHTPVASTEIFNKQMYVDTDNFVRKSEEYIGGGWDDSDYTIYGYAYLHNKDEWDELKSKVLSAGNEEDAKKIYEDYYNNNASDEMKLFMKYMKDEHDFNAAEWWKANK